MPPRSLALVWYVAYGSNLCADRLGCYLAGGRPGGAARTYEGCRDAAPPQADRPVWLPGRLGFGGTSLVWGGGIAFYDHRPGHGVRTAGRAYLLTHGQLSDLVAQETRQPVGRDLSLQEAPGHWPVPSAGLYESVLHLGHLDGLPMITLTTTRRPRLAAPAAAYLRTVAAGLREAHGWTAERVAAYLARAEGVRPPWSLGDLRHAAAPDA